MKNLLGYDSLLIKFIDSIIIILFAVIIYLIIRSIIEKIIDGKIANYGRNIKRRQTLLSILKNIVKYIVITIVLLIILSRFGINVNKLIAGLGIAGLVIGLGLQDIIKDFIAGIFILTDKGYEVGDIIEVDNFRGEVKEFGLKTTRIKNIHGEVRIVNNSNIRSFINCSLSNKKLIMDIFIDNKIDNEKILKILDKQIPKLYKIKGVRTIPVLVGLEEIIDNRNKYRMIFTCKYNDYFDIKREIIKMLKIEFNSKKPKIELFKIEVYNGK